MKENIKNENEGSNYAEKLEEKMLEKAAEKREEGGKPQIVDGAAQKDAPSADTSSQVAKVNLKYSLAAHFDQVRGAHFMQNNGCIATVSEDCLVKLWSFDKIQE